MEAKQAIAIAKDYLIDVLEGDLASPPRLEEVWLDGKATWHVIFGFYRQPSEQTAVAGLKAFSAYEKKVVRVDDATGKALSILDPVRDTLDH